jgi:hypothetical protein
MIEAKKLKEVYDYNKNRPVEGYVGILYDDGKCYIDSTTEISGLEINFQGKVEITPTLPDGWIMQGNNHKILIFSLQNLTLKNQQLFEYKGELKITTTLAANPQGKMVISKPSMEVPVWSNVQSDINLETKNWDDFTQKTNVGKVNKTKFNLPDYDLPKVNMKKISKKVKKNVRKNRSSEYRSSSGGRY